MTLQIGLVSPNFSNQRLKQWRCNGEDRAFSGLLRYGHAVPMLPAVNPHTCWDCSRSCLFSTSPLFPQYHNFTYNIVLGLLQVAGAPRKHPKAHPFHPYCKQASCMGSTLLCTVCVHSTGPICQPLNKGSQPGEEKQRGKWAAKISNGGNEVYCTTAGRDSFCLYQSVSWTTFAFRPVWCHPLP